MIKLLLLSICMLFSTISTKLFAQAYNGITDVKLFLGYAHMNGNSVAELQLDEGRSDLFSYGFKMNLVVSNNVDPKPGPIVSESNIINRTDLSLYGRFHLAPTFGMSEKTDPYLGVDFSFRMPGLHAGFKYFFSETFGIYLQGSGNFFAMFVDPDELDKKGIYSSYYDVKSSLSGGIVINL